MLPSEVARVRFPTPFGDFQLRAFDGGSGSIHLAAIAGTITDGAPVLTRVHSECLTGDALGSLRCDCGIQLRAALRMIGAAGRGVLVYATGHEGRGVGLVNKLRAYVEQDLGADTVDANLHLGLPVDGRDYTDAAAILDEIGVGSVELITNSPRKIAALRDAGVIISSVRPLTVAPNGQTMRYLQTKKDRLGHASALGAPLEVLQTAAPDVSALIGEPAGHADRPHVVVKYAQSMDGRIATTSGDARWISSEDERAISHALRARCDAIMVGVGTVCQDDPALTVRLVPGPSPLRVVFDSRLSAPPDAKVFDDAAPTVIITTDGSDPGRREEFRRRHVAVRVVPPGRGGVDMGSALARLREMGAGSLLVEGGQKIITSCLRGNFADRVVVSLAPIVLGKGIEGVGDLGTARVADAISLTNRSVQLIGNDVVIACDVGGANSDGRPTPSEGRQAPAARD